MKVQIDIMQDDSLRAKLNFQKLYSYRTFKILHSPT